MRNFNADFILNVICIFTSFEILTALNKRLNIISSISVAEQIKHNYLSIVYLTFFFFFFAKSTNMYRDVFIYFFSFLLEV